MKNILEKIVQTKREEIESRKKVLPIKALIEQISQQHQTKSMVKRILQPDLFGIIAEFKRKSPSKGVLHPNPDVESIIKAYAQFASGISVLTDEQYFGAKAEDFNVGIKSTVPVLRKDFIIDPYQVYETRAMGADVMLLIAACLTPQQVSELSLLAQSIGLEVLLELHEEHEIQHVCSSIDMIGINNRNLKNFQVDIAHSIRMAEQLPVNAVTIAESGIYSIEVWKQLKDAGFKGFLMGEYFMKEANPSEKFLSFIQEIQALCV